MDRKTSKLLIYLIQDCLDDSYTLEGYFVLGKNLMLHRNDVWSQINTREIDNNTCIIYKIINKNGKT